MRRYITLLLLLVATFAQGAELSPRTTYSLNDDWQFYFVHEGIASAEYVCLPHTWSDEECYTSTAHYIRNIAIPATMRGKRLFLRFGGAQSVAEVFVNGRYVGEHHGAYTAFTLEITDKVRYGENNILTVVVSNNPRADVLPISTDQNLYGGIYRDVELLVTTKNIISPMAYGTDGVFVEQREVTVERASGVVQVHLSAKEEGAHMVNMRIIAPDGYEVCSCSVKSGKADKPLPVELPFVIDYPELWSPEKPTLYRVEASVGNISNPTDKLTFDVGFRDVSVNNNNRLCINGKECAVRGVNLAHDRQGVGVALSRENLDEDLSTICDMGANALRSLSGPHSAYLYDRCDREGVLVWVDVPLTCSSVNFSDIYYYPTSAYKTNGFEQLTEIVYQNFNHPSVVMWGLFSLVSTRGDDVLSYIRELDAMVHSLDPSRLSVACSNRDGEINFITDLIVLRQDVGWTKGSYDDVAVWCDQLKANKKFSKLRYGVCYGEEGVVGHTTDEVRRTERGATYLPERNQTIMHEKYSALIAEHNVFWGVWLDNMFDYASRQSSGGMRKSGVVCYDHASKKDSYYLYRALWNKAEPTLYIAERKWQRRADKLQSVKVYSSVGRPELTVDDESVELEEVMPCVWYADSVMLDDVTTLRVVDASQKHHDSVKIIVDKLRVRR